MLFTSDQLKDLHISLLRSIERILFMSFSVSRVLRCPAGILIGDARSFQALAATLDYPRPHCGIDPMLDKINLDTQATLL